MKNVPEPTNKDRNLRPPTEMTNDTINPKFGYVETLDRIPFTGIHQSFEEGEEEVVT